MTPSQAWGPRLRELFRPEEPLKLSEWAERYRVLPRKGTAEPGRYNLDRTPYLRDILDDLGDRRVREVNFVKAAQIGGSEVGKSAIGGWIDTRNAPILLVLPNQDTAQEHLQDRIIPMLKEPRLRKYTTGRDSDITRSVVKLAHTTVYLGWSGSPQSLASRAIECAIFDETDKSQDHAKEANTIDLTRARLTTYPRSKLFTLSTPTTVDGLIWQTHMSCSDRREFRVPCPHCGAAQVLQWDQVRWERKDEQDETKFQEISDLLLAGDLEAWYECSECAERIEERDRLRIVQQGFWVSNLPPEQAARSVRRSYHISALYSPWVKFREVVVHFLRARVTQDYRHFYNSILGLPNEMLSAKPQANVLEARAKEHNSFVVPSWATVLTAGADTQARDGKPYWYWVIRAWGKHMKSRLIAWGRSDTLHTLKDSTLYARFPVEGTNETMTPLILCVDSGGASEIDTEDGNTTRLVYRMAREDPARVIPIKGHGGPSRPDRTITSKQVDYQPIGEAPTQVLLHTLDTETLKDRIAGLIKSDDPLLWEESAAALDKVYLNHMTAEEKSRVRIGRAFKLRWINTSRRRNDLWDATVYCLAGAIMLRAEYRREYKEQRDHERLRQQRKPSTPEPSPPGSRTDRGRRRRPRDERPRVDARPRSRGGGSGQGGWIKKRGR